MNTENNKIIAEFLGAISNKGGEYEMYGIIQNIEDELTEKHFYFGSEMLFDKDWNWLMEVVEKIEKIHILDICGKAVSINETNGEMMVDLNGKNYSSKIEAVYNACLEFIKWHNKQK